MISEEQQDKEMKIRVNLLKNIFHQSNCPEVKAFLFLLSKYFKLSEKKAEIEIIKQNKKLDSYIR